jgi:tetratricopeptide (TPR) repeat protein
MGFQGGEVCATAWPQSTHAKEALAVPEPEKKEPEAQGGPAGESQSSEELIPPEAMRTARDCFDRAEQATVKGNFDYAFHLYLDGLKYNPRDVEHGHKGLRDAAIKRKSGGKGGFGAFLSQLTQAKGAFSQMIGRGKDALMDLLASVARDPQNVMLLMQIMQTARRLNYPDVAIYYGELAAEETLKTRKPQKQVFTTLSDLYESQRRLQDAVNALSTAIKIDPADRGLDKRIRDLAAGATIEEGKLESVSDFRDMIRDKRQASASAQQQVVRTKEHLDAQYIELKADYDADPKNPLKIQALADCQARRGEIQEAMDLLTQALEISKDYRFKYRMDDIRMSEFRRIVRELDEQLQTEPDRGDLKAKRQQVVAERDTFEMAVYTERQQQYPTDTAVRYELGVRQLRQGSYDDAIVSLQVAARDPKRRVQALNALGKCFFAKKYMQEAQSQFETAIQQYELTGDPLSKDMRYNLAKCFEAQGKIQQAVDWYSVIVQQDYQYRDAAKRLDSLRRKLTEQA